MGSELSTIRDKLITTTSYELADMIAHIIETKAMNNFPKETIRDYLFGEFNKVLKQHARKENERLKLMLENEFLAN